jgi:hypothetical protein
MDVAERRWPDRSAAAFAAEVRAVARALEKLATSVDHVADALEASRTWRFAGQAYADLGEAGERAAFERAASAYRAAEALLEGRDEPVDLMKLNFWFGSLLIDLCDKKDPVQVSAGCERLKTSLALARRHRPESVAPLEKQIAQAQQIVALLTQAQGLDQQITQLGREAEQRALDADAIRGYLAILNQQFEKEKPSLDSTRRATLSDLMQRLPGVVQDAISEGQTLDQMLANKAQLESLKREARPLARRPSLKGPGAPVDSRNARVLAALLEQKMFVATLGMDPSTPMAVRDEARDLVARIARLATEINRTGTDVARLGRLEYDQARPLAHEVRILSRLPHLTLARPVWPIGSSAVDPNRVFFSGSDHVRVSLAAVCGKLGLQTVVTTPAGADFAVDRWEGLRSSGIAVFDLGGAAPQVCYELGIALALGTQLVLLAPEDVDIPFDVAQNVDRYPRGGDVSQLLERQLDVASYGLHARSGKISSLPETLRYAEWLARADHGDARLGVALQALRNAGDDPSRFNQALNTFNTFLGRNQQAIVSPRWPCSYPDPVAPRWFAVMPFRTERESVYEVLRECARQAGIAPVRGDTAEGQEIIASIWQELCRATHVTVDLSGFNLNVCLELGIAHTLGRSMLLVAEKGTEQRIAKELPGCAKWRLHTYDAHPGSNSGLLTVVTRFFAQTAA